MFKPTNKNDKSPNMRIIPFKECLAKTIQSEPTNQAGVSVSTHCRIVGHVALELIKRMPAWLRKQLFPSGSELVAAVHDIGKISPAFQEKIHRAIGEPLEIANPDLDKAIGYHSSVSQAAAVDCPKYIPEILGRHHGKSPQSTQPPDAEIYGGPNWQAQRIELIDLLKNELKADWPKITSHVQADALAGLTTVADWVGSGDVFEAVNDDSWKTKINEALDQAGFVTPSIRLQLSFKQIFGFSPYPLQSRFVESVSESGVYVLEAPMGIGKTEAALFAGYKLLEQEAATGIYFALPTQLTSDKVFERMTAFLGGDIENNLEGILDKQDPNRKALLLHGAAWLRETEIGEEGAPGKSWFSSPKRGLLAPFAVGTIDQALMAVMNVKHGFVRTFGLAGKVVILDEVHSYDSYTGTIINELVKALRELHCTVIILSATLTDEQRYAILNIENTRKKKSAYPLITAYPLDKKVKEIKTAKMENGEVNIHICQEDRALEEALKRAERGEQVLWLENTVAEAQVTYRKVASREVAIECGLLHSRFTKLERRQKEDYWVGIFGKNGKSERQQKGRLLVGTQVLEQSLDIDADFMATKICPTDMIFQRIGRLWRHRNNDDIRPHEAKREAWIIAPELKSAIEDRNNFGKSHRVYSPYILCRTLEVWNAIETVNLPSNIRPMLEATYKERKDKNEMAIYKSEMESMREKLERFALVGISRGGVTQPESKATTRYSEIESTEVLLIKAIRLDSDKTVIRLMNDEQVVIPKKASIAERRKIGTKLLNHTVMVPDYLAPNTSRKQMEWLKDYVYLGDEEESPFRAAIVRDSNELVSLGQNEASGKYELEYDACLGYIAKKKGR